MKIIAILGSPRPNGNTSFLIDEALQEASKHGLETEKIILAQYKVNPCLGHEHCASFPVCKQEDDAPAILEKFRNADGIILGSPVYYYDMTAQMKAFIDRNYFLFRHRIHVNAVCAGLIAIGGGGGMDQTIASMRRFVKITSGISNEKILAMTGCASNPGDVQSKKDLIAEAGKLGSQMADIITSDRKSE